MDGDQDSELLREARRAGIRVGHPVSAKSVRRRRRQLYVLVTLVVLAVGVGLAQLVVVPEATNLLLPRNRAVLALTALTVTFCIYCLEKEVHLRRVERLLVAECQYSAEVIGRLGDITSLLEAGRAVNSALVIEEVLDAVLTNALALFTGATGSVSLVDGADELVCVSAIGNPHAVGSRTRFGQGISGQVALSRQAVIVSGHASPERFPGVAPRGRPEDSAMSVPLIHRGRLLGVLNVTSAGQPFEDYDLRLLRLFAEQATSGIVHARTHEEDTKRVETLVRLEQSKTEFIAGVSHDLRTPLTSIVGCTTMARRPDIDRAQRDEMLEIAESQARKLAAMVERLLISAELGQQAPTPKVAPVDVMAVLSRVIGRYVADGRNVAVDVEAAGIGVLADVALLDQAVSHLVDNALLHGAAPVRVGAQRRGGHVAITVSDSGPGIPEADRERVFERFVRLDANRSTPGIGLGLPIARALIGAIDGTLDVEATQDGADGARLTIALPPAELGPAPAELHQMIPAQMSPERMRRRLLRPGTTV